jgi:1-acyl-sn-glycerol-3-phosphate acyltransferase
MNLTRINHNALIDKLIQRFLFKSGYFYFKLLCRGKISGREKVNECLSTGFVAAANHSSYLDAVVSHTWDKSMIIVLTVKEIALFMC